MHPVVQGYQTHLTRGVGLVHRPNEQHGVGPRGWIRPTVPTLLYARYSACSAYFNQLRTGAACSTGLDCVVWARALHVVRIPDQPEWVLCAVQILTWLEW